jgi:hydroxymethylpyrimidine/phosphomethylpyrimidine kinase
MSEAAALSGLAVRGLAEMRAAGKVLAAKYGTRVLLKGGHLVGAKATDLLFEGDAIAEYSRPFVRGLATHGTGCTYSAAIAAGLARGLLLRDAIAGAKDFVSRAIREHFSWRSSLGEIHALNSLGKAG